MRSERCRQCGQTFAVRQSISTTNNIPASNKAIVAGHGASNAKATTAAAANTGISANGISEGFIGNLLRMIGFKNAADLRLIKPANDHVHLPGRLQERCVSENQAE